MKTAQVGTANSYFNNIVPGLGSISGSKARVSQEGIIVVNQGTPKARVSQEGIAVVNQGTPKARVSQDGVIVVNQGSPKARISQYGILVVNVSAPEIIESITSTLTLSQTLSDELTNIITKSVTSTLTITQLLSETLTNVITRSLTSSLFLTQTTDYDTFGDFIVTNAQCIDSVIDLNQTLSYSIQPIRYFSIGHFLHIFQLCITYSKNHRRVTYSRTINQSIFPTQNIDNSFINFYLRTINQSLSLTQFVHGTTGNIFSQSLNQSLTLTQSLSNPISRTINQSLSLIQSINYTLKNIISRTINQSLSLTQSNSKVKSFERVIMQSLPLTTTLNKQKIIKKIIKQAIPIITTLNKNISRNLSIIQTINFSYVKYLNYLDALAIPDVIVTKNNFQNVQLQYSGLTIILPPPAFDDSQSLMGAVNVRRTMVGGVYSYIKRPDTSKLNYTFNLPRDKYYELINFIKTTISKPVTLHNWKDEIWIGYLTNDNFENTEHRDYDNEVELQFEGIKLNGH